MIASYNSAEAGDVLILILNQDTKDQTIEKHGDVVKIIGDNDKVLGYNFFNISKVFSEIKTKSGQIDLTDDDLTKLNHVLEDNNFTGDLKPDLDSHFVVGYVRSVEPHPDSDHLKITQTEIDGGKTLQIVSGSPNMKADIKVVVAKSGTMMPSGLIIWPGKLKKVESDGMICSGRELRLPNAPQKPGALILPDDFEVGTAFDFDKGAKLFK